MRSSWKSDHVLVGVSGGDEVTGVTYNGVQLSEDSMPRNPRPLTIATKNATKRLIADYPEVFRQYVEGEMAALGYVQQTVTWWGKSE